MLTSLAMGALAAALIVPRTRRAFLGDIDHDWLAGELELDEILPDGITVRTKSGLYSRVIHIAGQNYDAKTIPVQENLLKGRNTAFHTLGDHGLALRFFGVKRPRDISYEADWPSPALREIGSAEQDRFRRSFVIDWYLVATGSVAARLTEGLEKFFAAMSDYAPEYVRRSDTGPCPLTGFLNGLVCGDYRTDLPAISTAISGTLPASDFHADRTTGKITTFLPEAHYQKIITVRAWPESVDGRLQHDILSLAGEIEISQTCLPISNVKAIALLSRREKELNAGITRSITVESVERLESSGPYHKFVVDFIQTDMQGATEIERKELRAYLTMTTRGREAAPVDEIENPLGITVLDMVLKEKRKQ